MLRSILECCVIVAVAALFGCRPEKGLQVVEVSLPPNAIHYGLNAHTETTVVQLGVLGCESCTKFIRESFPTLDSSFFRKGTARFVYVDVAPDSVSGWVVDFVSCGARQSGYTTAVLTLEEIKRSKTRTEAIVAYSRDIQADTNAMQDCVQARRAAIAAQPRISAPVLVGLERVPALIVGRVRGDTVVGWLITKDLASDRVSQIVRRAISVNRRYQRGRGNAQPRP